MGVHQEVADSGGPCKEGGVQRAEARPSRRDACRRATEGGCEGDEGCAGTDERARNAARRGTRN